VNAEEAGTDVAVLISYSGDGGVERMINHLVGGMLTAGRRVDVLVLKDKGGHSERLPADASVRRLGTRHAALAVPALVRYLGSHRPRVLLAAKERGGRAALRARDWARVATPVVVRLGNTVAPQLAGRAWPVRAWRRRALARVCQRADGIVAVAEGVAREARAFGAGGERVQVIANPVITGDGEARAREGTGHPWLDTPDEPVVVGMGRLATQKDWPTLLRAVAQLRERRALRLVIVGEGPERSALEGLARSLGIADAVSLPGFVSDPYPWLARASVFVLSSAWEGSPNALTEAMHLGRPVVATDCPSGPRELLDHGRLAPLVPVGDDHRLARAIDAALTAPADPAALRAAVRDYTVEASAARYLECLDRVEGQRRC